MFTFFNKRKHDQGVNAIVLSEQGIAFASVLSTPSQTPVLQAVDFMPLDNPADLASSLKTFADRHKLEHRHVVTTLQMNEASLVMLEKPNVADNELRQAVRWSLKDSLSFDIENAIIDVFEIPGQKERGRTPLIYATAAEKSFLQHRIHLLEELEMAIDAIDIPELAMRNVAALLPEDANGVALLKLDADQGLITLTQNKSLFLARNIDTGYRNLAPASGHSVLGEPEQSDGLQFESGMSPDQQRALDSIVLEVQRSLDYYESHFAMPAITTLVLAPLPFTVPGLSEQLSSLLGVKVRTLDTCSVLDCQVQASEEVLAQSFMAIATALRMNEKLMQGEAA